MIFHTAHTQTTFFEHLSSKISSFEKQRSLAYITFWSDARTLGSMGSNPAKTDLKNFFYFVIKKMFIWEATQVTLENNFHFFEFEDHFGIKKVLLTPIFKIFFKILVKLSLNRQYILGTFFLIWIAKKLFFKATSQGKLEKKNRKRAIWKIILSEVALKNNIFSIQIKKKYQVCTTDLEIILRGF